MATITPCCLSLMFNRTGARRREGQERKWGDGWGKHGAKTGSQSVIRLQNLFPSTKIFVVVVLVLLRLFWKLIRFFID